MLSKYIQEKGIILLIKFYAHVRVEEILNIIFDVKQFLYCSTQRTNKIIDRSGLKHAYININCLTKNTLLLLRQHCDDYGFQSSFVTVHKIKFNQNRRKNYVKAIS